MEDKAPEEVRIGQDDTIKAWRSYEFHDTLQDDMKKARKSGRPLQICK